MESITYDFFFLYIVRNLPQLYGKWLVWYLFINEMINRMLKNRPVSLLLIFSKIFERLIYNEMYSFSTGNDLISPNQSGFKHSWSAFLPFFCFSLLSMIYLMVSTVTENSLKMIPHYLQQRITLTKHQMI